MIETEGDVKALPDIVWILDIVYMIASGLCEDSDLRSALLASETENDRHDFQ